MTKINPGKIFQDVGDILTLKFYFEEIMVRVKLYLLLLSFCALWPRKKKIIVLQIGEVDASKDTI